MQNIPSHNHSIRLLFKAKSGYTNIDCDDNILKLFHDDKVETNTGLKYAQNIKKGDMIKVINESDEYQFASVIDIVIQDSFIFIYF